LDRQELIPNFGFSTLTEISTGDNDGADAHIKSDAGTGTTTWSLLRDGVTISVAKTDPVLYVALQSSSSMVSGQYDHMTRTIINFDTSSGLINTLNITAADINLKLNQNYDYDDTPHYWSDTYYKLGFFNLACADPSIPATGDWDNFGSTLLTESKPIVDITSVDSYYSWSITDLSYIKVFGISEFGLMALGDGYNITPTWKNGLWWIRFYSEEYSGSSYAPRLDVTWEERVSINIGDSWKIIEDIQINVGDTWKSLSSLNINISDIWKTVF